MNASLRDDKASLVTSCIAEGVPIANLKQRMQDKLVEHKQCIDKYGKDLPEIREWKWEKFK